MRHRQHAEESAQENHNRAQQHLGTNQPVQALGGTGATQAKSGDVTKMVRRTEAEK